MAFQVGSTATQIGITYYTKSGFARAKSAGLFRGDDFENYDEWLKAHYELISNVVERDFKVSDVEVRVSELLKWRKKTKRYDEEAVSHYVAELLARVQNILTWYNQQ